MTAPVIKVELGLDLGDRSPQGFRLDDAVRGVLDGLDFVLGGELFIDITDRLSAISIKRGKSQALDRIDAGIANITVNNNDRLFDPLFEGSQFFGVLVPRKRVRVTANDRPVYSGFIEDLDLNYLPENRSTVLFSVADGLSLLTNAAIEDYTPVSELSGARINAVLDLAEVSWDSDNRNIDAGNSVMLDADVADGTSVLEYLKLVSTSEQGNLFIGKDGKLVFQERNASQNAPDIIFSDNLSASAAIKIPFLQVNNVFGSENLHNIITVENADVFPETVVVEDLVSIGAFGARAFSLTGILIQEPTELISTANRLLLNFKDPLYRFNSVVIDLDRLTEVQQNSIFDLEIGDIVQVEFTPNGIPPAIELPCRILGVSQEWGIERKQILFSLESLNFGVFVLDSDLFGELDDDRLGY